jgi:Ni2+-binding GTPase involved in maturation of urease and hydrogenase
MFLYENAGNLVATGTEYLKDHKHAVVFIIMPTL